MKKSSVIIFCNVSSFILFPFSIIEKYAGEMLTFFEISLAGISWKAIKAFIAFLKNSFSSFSVSVLTFLLLIFSFITELLNLSRGYFKKLTENLLKVW